MRRRRAEQEDAVLSMTPLIDVVLLLLIFYIVTTSFVDREIDLQLPESDSSAMPDDKKKIVIEIGRNVRDLAIDGERTTIDGIDRTIAAEAAADNIQSVQIKADREVRHGRVIEVLGIVKKHGVDAVGIAVKQKAQ